MSQDAIMIERLHQKLRPILLNPTYTGLGPYPAIFEDDEWIASAMTDIAERGGRDTIETILNLFQTGFPILQPPAAHDYIRAAESAPEQALEQLLADLRTLAKGVAVDAIGEVYDARLCEVDDAFGHLQPDEIAAIRASDVPVWPLSEQGYRIAEAFLDVAYVGLGAYPEEIDPDAWLMAALEYTARHGIADTIGKVLVKFKRSFPMLEPPAPDAYVEMGPEEGLVRLLADLHALVNAAELDGGTIDGVGGFMDYRTNGWVLGGTSLFLPRIELRYWDQDAVIAGNRLEASLLPLGLDEIEEITSHLVWSRWEPPVPNFLNVPGVWGLTPEWEERAECCAMHFLYEGDPLQALREIIEREGGLPYSIVGAALAAATCEHRSTTPNLISLMCRNLAARFEGDRLPDRPLSRRQTQDIAERCVEHLLAGGSDLDLPVPTLDPISCARVLIAISKLLWQPRYQVRFARSELEELEHQLVVVLAEQGLRMRKAPAVEVNGTRLSYNPDYIFTDAWSQCLEFNLWGGLPAEGIRFLTNGQLTPIPGPVLWERSASPATLPDAELCRAMAAGLLREAAEQGVFVPAAGAFTLSLPCRFPLRDLLGVGALRVWIQEWGEGEVTYWAGLVRTDGLPLGHFGWQAGHPLSPWVLHRDLHPVVELTMAGLYHDLRIAGPEALPETQARAKPRRHIDHQARRQRRRRRRSRHLPSPRHVGSIHGYREWGTREERDVIHRRRHAVRGHIRLLPDGWSASGEAQERARLYGQVLPYGYTFVKPHHRGRDDTSPDPGTPEIEGTPIKVRGLATILTHFSGHGEQK